VRKLCSKGAANLDGLIAKLVKEQAWQMRQGILESGEI